MGIIIFAILAILATVVVLLFRVFSIERVEAIIQDVNSAPDAEGDEATDDAGEDAEEIAKPAEVVDLFDYFDEGSETNDESEITEETLEEIARNTDKLTDFTSGRRYLVDCHKMLEAAKDDGHIYCALYFDYDRFSYINSLKGAATGDYVLTHTAQQIRRILPEGALITRLSCDHFTAVFPLVDLALFDDYYEQLRRMCEKIRNDIAAKAGMRICVGFATTDNDSSYNVNVLLTRANIARHSSKVTKSEKFDTYDETMLASNFYGDSLMDNYSECQYGDDFAMYFECQIDLVSDKIIGCDALVRWACEDNNKTPITLETGCIPTNNDKVIYQVCRAMSRWRKAAREPILVFVDMPVTYLFKADIDDFIGKCFTEFQIEPQTLAVKVDVSIVRLDWSMSSKQFKKLREIGVKLCISGVDTGYSNLDFLSGLSIDYIKLHRSFAHNIEKKTEQLEKCRRIIERATSINARTIFEGVDTMDQVTSLRSINAKTVQGKYSGRPYTADDLARDLPEHVERRTSDATVILDEAQLAKGEWTAF